MPKKPPPSERAPDNYRVNFFRPRPGYMRRRVLYTWFLLILWASFSFGFQLLLSAGVDSRFLTGETLFGFPFHYWFTGQFLIVWFIFLCLLFNVFIDRLTRQFQKRNRE